MKFIIQEPKKKQNFSLIYRSEDYSFDIEPLEESGVTSIMINTLQLEIDDYGEIIYVWGYCPLIKYEETDEVPRGYNAYTLIAQLDDQPIPGISYSLSEDARWSIYINKKKGWVCLGNPQTKNRKLVEFAPNCVAAMDGQELTAVWLHPKNLPKFN